MVRTRRSSTVAIWQCFRWLRHICMYTCVCVCVCMAVSVSVSVSVSGSVSVCLCLSVSVCIWLSFCLSVCLSVCLSERERESLGPQAKSESMLTYAHVCSRMLTYARECVCVYELGAYSIVLMLRDFSWGLAKRPHTYAYAASNVCACRCLETSRLERLGKEIQVEVAYAYVWGLAAYTYVWGLFAKPCLMLFL